MMRRTVAILVLVWAVAVSAMAVPARRDGMVRTAADGTEKTVYLHGDAFFHYMTDADGNWLDEESLMPISAEQKATQLEQGKARVQARRKQQVQMASAPKLPPRGLLLLVNFQNKSFVTPYDTIREMLNGENFHRQYKLDYTYTSEGETRVVKKTVKASGSARQYFRDQSFGAYCPTFDIMGPFTVSQDYSYYGKNNDAKVGEMVKEACQLADQQGADFTLYDSDNDGEVDFVYILYAGEGEADGGPANTIWPHNYNLSALRVSCTLDGKDINNYACSNEWQHYGNVYNGIGTFCHEFSHVLGLPDLYETSSVSTGVHTSLEWDIMDYGPYNNDGNTPPDYSAYERFYCGWLTPRVLTAPESVWLGILRYNKSALLMCEGDSHNLVGYDPYPNTFYLLENRAQMGWDQYLPGKGLLITKIQYNYNKWTLNMVNNSSKKMGVDILEATANNTKHAVSTDAYPAGATEFTEFSGHEITEIELDEQGAISFSYRGAKKTPIESINDGQTAQKVLKDGQILIVRGDKTYDMLGRETVSLVDR